MTTLIPTERQIILRRLKHGPALDRKALVEYTKKITEDVLKKKNSVARIVAFTILFTGCLALAQQPKADPPVTPKSAPAIPTISLQLLKDFYAADSARLRAQAEMTQAQASVQSAQASWTQAVTAMQKACGGKYQLHQDSVSADPDCVLKPVTAPEAKPAASEKK